MKTFTARIPLVALIFGACISLKGVALAQPANQARRVTMSQLKKFKWPTFRQVKHSRSVPEVKALQFLLRNQGFFKGQPDGVFHDNTTRSVRAFQRTKGLKADGVVGAQTWQPLLLRLKRGDKGDAVRALQTVLRTTTNHVGESVTPDLPVDGTFGFQTEEALRIAQENMNWPEKQVAVDGIAGPQMWSLLLIPSVN